MANRIGFRTGERNVVALLGTEAKRSADLARRKVWFIHDDGTEKEADYDNPSFGNSANTLLVAKVGDKFYAAVGIEFKPGLLPDNTNSLDLPPQVFSTPSGISVTIPAGAIVTVFGGYNKPNDADAQASAMRELKEESGFDAVSLIFVGKMLVKPAWTNANDTLFLAFGEKAEDFSVQTDVSIAKRLWMPFDDLVWLMQKTAGMGAEVAEDAKGSAYYSMTAVTQAAFWLAANRGYDLNKVASLFASSAMIAAA